MIIKEIASADQPVVCQEHPEVRAQFWILLGGTSTPVCAHCIRTIAVETDTHSRGGLLKLPLTFEQLSATNAFRTRTEFHAVDDWYPWEWSNAMAGEVGEACNLTKKMRRIYFPHEKSLARLNKPGQQTLTELEEAFAGEVADAVIYGDLAMTRIRRNLGDEVRKKFNSKSAEVGSSIVLP